MCESLFAEIKGLAVKIEAKYSHNIHFISTTTVTHTSNKNCPLYPTVLPAATLGQAVNANLKLYKLASGRENMSNLTHSMESSMPEVVLRRLASEPTVPEQQ